MITLATSFVGLGFPSRHNLEHFFRSGKGTKLAVKQK